LSPKVSIGIPAYNAVQYIEAAINSALSQSVEDIEVFVCDNQSSDATPAVCADIQDRRFRYLRFEGHVGQPGNWNRCVRESRGEFVVLLHADDVLEPGFVGRAVAAMEGAPHASMVHCAVKHIGADGGFLFLQSLGTADHETPGAQFFQRLLLEGCIVNPAGVMVRRRAFKKAGLFFEGVKWGTDWDMWLRLSLEGSVVSIADELALYREHSSSGTAAVVASGRNGRDELLVIDHVLGLVPGPMKLPEGLRAAAIERAAHRTWCWAEEACRAGHPGASRRGVWEALRMNPRLVRKGHVWGLFLASFFGYEFFQRLQRLKHNALA